MLPPVLKCSTWNRDSRLETGNWKLETGKWEVGTLKFRLLQHREPALEGIDQRVSSNPPQHWNRLWFGGSAGSTEHEHRPPRTKERLERHEASQLDTHRAERQHPDRLVQLRSRQQLFVAARFNRRPVELERANRLSQECG